MNKQNLLKASIFSAGLFMLPLAQAAEVRLLVHGEHVGTDVVYHYTLVNNGLGNMLDFTIGLIPAGDGDNYFGTITRLPTGTTWTPDPESPSFTNKDLPVLSPASVMSPAQPAGWSVRASGYREGENFAITWKAPDPDYNVPHVTGANAGQTLTGFTVRVPANSGTGPGVVGTLGPYVTGNFRANVSKGVSWPENMHGREIFAAIEKQDTLPPTLSVTLAPSTMRAGSKLLSVSAAITVTDNYDLASEIKLESIVANQTLRSGDIADATFGTNDRAFKLKPVSGRVYTVTYSATDGTGNKATASATVAVKK